MLVVLVMLFICNRQLSCEFFWLEGRGLWAECWLLKIQFFKQSSFYEHSKWIYNWL